LTGSAVPIPPGASAGIGASGDPVVLFMTTIEPFLTSYQDARRKFLEAAARRNALLDAFVHPSIRGPAGEDLAVDVAALGQSSSERTLMIVSGTHGVEGYAGSACQLHLLQSDVFLEVAASTQLILVHAINPYGFAYNRRVNEDNIDLNRNFIDFSAPLPVNPNYSECAEQFLSHGSQLTDYQAAEARLDAAAQTRGGYQFFKTALQPGQYAHPEGLYFGGSGPCWSNRIFTQICERYVSQAARAAVLDIHTGLGPSGVGELIFLQRDTADSYAHLFSPPVSCAGGKASLAVELSGPLASAAYNHITGNMAICGVLEVGTVPIEENVKAMLFENWTHRCLSSEHPLYRESHQRLRNAYYFETSSWKRSLTDRFVEITRRLHQCLLGT
jgi:hypothetical protein